MTSPDYQIALNPVFDAFDRLGIEYYVGGSLASSAYGVWRTTIDADVIADVQSSHVAPLVSALQADYYIDAEMIRHAIARRSSFNVVHLATMFKVDVFILKETAFDRAMFERRRREPLGGSESGSPQDTVFVATPEDIVLHKLLWYRKGHEVSERQWRDVLEVLRVQRGKLDRSYMEHWAKETGVADLLSKALEQAKG